MIRVFLSRVLDLLFRRRREARLAEEVEAHLDLLTEEYVAQGLSREEARYAARRAFGGVDRMKALHREQRGLPAIDSLMQDLRYAGRLLLKDRRFTLAAVAALALGIGANTTAFTFVNAVVLREMSLERPDRLMTVSTTKEIGGRLIGASYADFKDWREASRAFSQLIVSIEVPMNVTDEGLPPERYWGSLISYDAFRMLGKMPILGRDFTADDDRPDSSVAIIAHSLWKGRYGSDPAIIGRTIRVNERPLTIIGVMPPAFHFMTVAEMWRPSSAALPATLNGRRDARTPYTWVVGRLAAPWYTIVGVSPTVPHNVLGQEPEPVVYVPVEAEPVLTRFASIAARSPLERAAVVARLRQEMAAVDPDLPGYWVQTVDQILAQSRWMHRVFGLMLALLAIIALTLASVGLYAVTAHGVAQRSHEIGIRMALGANAGQVMWLFVLRTLWQISVGLAIGLAAMVATGSVVQSLLMQIGPIHVSPHDPVTLAMVALFLVIIAAAAGILPARRAARLDPVVALRDE